MTFLTGKLSAALALTVLLTACAQVPTPNTGMDRSAARVGTALPPLVITGPPDTAYTPQSGSDSRFAFRGTELPQALRLLFADSGINLMMDDQVDGTVTADFVGLPPERVLSTLMAKHGLTVEYRDGTAHIAPETSRVFTIDYVAGIGQEDIWDEIDTQIHALLSENGHLSLGQMTGTLVVTDRADVLTKVAHHLEMLQEIISRQVLIEARVIEVTLNDGFQMGVNYSAFPRVFGAKLPGQSGNPVQGAATGGNALSAAFSSVASSFQFGVFRSGEFSALLDALSTQGQVNMLSSPRISTLNNRPAVINVTEQIPVVSREVIGGEVDASTTRETYDVSFRDAGIKLEVTPQIGANGNMTVMIHPTVTEVSGSITTPDGLQTLPIINQRETETVLKVHDGETILLGGFIQNRLREEISKIPLLGDIPALGALFRRTTQDNDRVELIILLTPKVMNKERIAQTVTESLTGVHDMARPFHFGILHNTRFVPEAKHAANGFSLTPLKQGMPHYTPGGFTPVTRRGLAQQALGEGRAYLANDRPAAAEKAWLKALDISPNNAEAHFQLAQLYAGQARQNRSMRHFEAVAQLIPAHPWGFNRLALAHTGNGNFDPAIQVLRHALTLFPDHPALLTNLGVAYLGKGLPELAQAAFGRTIRLHPNAQEARLNQAEMMAAQGDPLAAVALLKQSLPKLLNNPEFYLRVKRRIMNLNNGVAASEAETT